MKNQVLKITRLFFISLVLISCKEATNKTKAKEAEEAAKATKGEVIYKADIENSVILWKGFKVGDSHNGTIHFSEAYIAVTDGKLSAGDFTIDMNTIKNVDITDPEDNAQITNHLKSNDFFDVATYKSATFIITDVNEEIGMYMVKGNLTIKGIKKNIEFPATITVNGDEVTFKSEPFTIDRTEWNVKYNSGKFFDNLKDKLIKDEIEFVVEVKAKK